MKMESVYFVRHGQSLWNVENKICGVTDISLTDAGLEQADRTGRILADMDTGAERILYSPLSRAAETAKRISAVTGIPADVDTRLLEQNFGIYEGTARNGKEFQEAKRQFLCRFGGRGESMFRVAQRVYNLLDELKGRPGRSTILVAHNGIARIVRSYFMEMNNEEFAAFGVKNCEVLRFDF